MHDPLTARLEAELEEAANIQPLTSAEMAGPEAGPDTAAPSEPLAKVSKSFITWMVMANFGASLAYIVPLAFSLAVRISQLEPGHPEVLGFVGGAAQLTFIITSPLLGMWSDRLRSRLGRRRPFMIAGLALGLAGLAVIALANAIPVLAAGWILAMLGFGNTQSAISNMQADKLPEEQRAKVSGLTGVGGQISPILGVGLASTVVSSPVLLFLLPGLIGALMILPLVFRSKDADSRQLSLPHEKITVGRVAASYVFDPRKAPDFAWNWLGRFVFFLGLYANTTFSTYFYAQRLHIPVEKVGSVVAVIGLLGIASGILGGVGAGFLSDKLRRRKLFTIIGVVLFGIGAVVEAFAFSLPTLIIGSLFMNCAIAAFSTVDQAIMMAVLPDKAQAGRYLAVGVFAAKIPSAIAPLLAPLVIGIGAVGAEKNYTLLYLIGAALALVGGLIIVTRVRNIR